MRRLGHTLFLSTSVILGCAGEEPSFHARPVEACASAERGRCPGGRSGSRGAPLPAPSEPLSAETSACHQRAAAMLRADPSHLLAARSELECACGGGEATSCTTLGALHGADGEAPDPALSLAALRRACELGDSFGCTNLGTALSRIYADPAGARDAWLRACDLGDALGCANAAASIGLGRAGPPDLPRARELFRLACERGDAPSCAHLATVGL